MADKKVRWLLACLGGTRFFNQYHSKSLTPLSVLASLRQKLRAAVVAKMVSQAWKALNDDERSKWIEMGRLDRERYEREKKSYKGPWKVPDVKNPNGPKKPMSSFLAFSNERRRALAQANPNMNGTELSCLLAKLWKESPAEVKQQYKERELRERQIFKKCRAEWERRQDLAARVAQWTQEMPNGEDLCTEFQNFMNNDDGHEETDASSSSGSSEGSSHGTMDGALYTLDDSSRVVSLTSSPILSATTVAAPINLAPINPTSCPAASVDMVDDTPLPFDFLTWAQTSPVTAESALGIVPVLKQGPSSAAYTTIVESTAHVACGTAAAQSHSPCCYDQYSMDDILQDDELFEDFSPRDVPRVPLGDTAAAWNPTPMTHSRPQSW